MKMKNKLLILGILLSLFVFRPVNAANGIYSCNGKPCICVDPGIAEGSHGTIRDSNLANVDETKVTVNDRKLNELEAKYEQAKKDYEKAKKAAEKENATDEDKQKAKDLKKALNSAKTAYEKQEKEFIENSRKISSNKTQANMSAAEYGMLSILAKYGYGNNAARAVRMLSLTSGYSMGFNYESTCNEAVQCLKNNAGMKKNLNIINGGGYGKCSANLSYNGANCEAFKYGLQQAADFKQGVLKIAKVYFKKYQEKQVADDRVLVFAQLTLRNVDNNSTFKFDSVDATNAISTSLIGYSSQFSEKEEDYKPFPIGQNMIGTLKSLERTKNDNKEIVVYLAFALTVDPADVDKDDCDADINIKYTFDDNSILYGIFYGTPATRTQRFIHYTGSSNIDANTNDDAAKYIRSEYKQSRDTLSLNDINKCGKCDPDGGDSNTEAGYPQICKDGDTPDKNDMVTYKYREGYTNGRLNIKRCIMNKSDAAQNLYRRNDVSNRYCSVSCKEEYTFKMPYKVNVNAGRYFKLGMEIEGKLECFSSGVDTSKFNRDLVYGQKAMIDAYNDYRMAHGGGNGYSYEITEVQSDGATIYNIGVSGVSLSSNNSLDKTKTKKALDRAIKVFDGYIEDYNNCSDWDLNYNFDPKVSYEYDEPQTSENKWVQFGSKNSSMNKTATSESDVIVEYCTDKNFNQSTYRCAAPSSTKPADSNQQFTICSTSGCTAQNRAISTVITTYRTQTKKATYDTPRVFYVNHSTGNIRVGNVDDRKAGEDVVQGLPVDQSTPTGSYYYRMSVKDLGMFFYNNGVLGRIYGGKTSVINAIKKGDVKTPTGLTVGKNVYACTYKVNEPLCEGHTDEECDFTKETREECIKRICPVCDDDPSMDLTDCIKECKQKDPNKTDETCKKECEKAKCGKYCVKEAQSYYVCTGTTYDSKNCKKQKDRNTALTAVGCTIGKDCDRNFNCCPNCTVFCIDGKCIAETKCKGPQCPVVCIGKSCVKDIPTETNLLVDFREITASNVNPNKRTMGYNWNIENPTNSLVAEKAKQTINEIQASVPEKIETATPTTSDTSNSNYTMKVTMTPDMASKIKEYNKAQETKGSYSNDTLKCQDYIITSKEYNNLANNKDNCEKAGYTWLDNKCVIQNSAGCYSTFIDDLTKGKYGGEVDETSKSIRAASKNINQGYKTYSGTTSQYGKIVTDNYSTIRVYESLDTNGDGIPNVGPAWK